jgi:hypothetical protein
MSCQRCNSKRMLHINAKTSDRCFAYFDGHERDGYAPEIPGIGGDDYVEFRLCLDCGQVRGEWPVEDKEVAKAFGGPVYCDACCEEFEWPNDVLRCRRCRKSLCQGCGGGGRSGCEDICTQCQQDSQPAW